MTHSLQDADAPTEDSQDSPTHAPDGEDGDNEGEDAGGSDQSQPEVNSASQKKKWCHSFSGVASVPTNTNFLESTDAINVKEA